MRHRVGVSTVASEDGQIVLILPTREDGDYSGLAVNLGVGVRMSKNKIWLPRAAHEKEWREQLLKVLAQLAAERGQPEPSE